MEWKPKAWVVVLLSLLLQPFTFLYLQKVRWFWIYLLLLLLLGFADLRYGLMTSLLLVLVCLVHGLWLIRRGAGAAVRNWYSRGWGLLLVGAGIFIPVLLIRSFLYEPFVIPASSMSPAIEKGDLILVEKSGYGNYGTYGISFRLGNPAPRLQVGEIYVFYPPHKDTVPYGKRVIGGPGDSLDFSDNQVRVNGVLLSRSLLTSGVSFDIYTETLDQLTYPVKLQHAAMRSMQGRYQVPDGHYFMVGDNRDNSLDSRAFGPVAADRMVGKVVLVIPAR